MPQLNSISANNFQKDVSAVFNRYGMDFDEALDFLIKIPRKSVKPNVKKEKIIDLEKVASPQYLKELRASIKELEEGKVVTKTLAELMAMEK
ncbi:MAG: hypothetical protein LBV16_00125 [Elusimicrobiota bacterium]|jgi:hypothetical protein|nr:hypothetical protein [Elusimicrobiota bacterium]